MGTPLCQIDFSVQLSEQMFSGRIALFSLNNVPIRFAAVVSSEQWKVREGAEWKTRRPLESF